MAGTFDRLESELPIEARQEARIKAMEMLAEMSLQELRIARQMSQADVAEGMSVQQAAVSRLERRPDVLISTLSEYVRAMGGELELVARFPEGPVSLNLMKAS